MRQVKYIMLVLALVCTSNSNWAQIKVKNGDLYYNLSGTKATVTYNRSDNAYYSSQTYYYPSNYNQEEYVIPAFITYNENEYEVIKVDDGAFAAFYANYLNGGGSRNYYTDCYGYIQMTEIKKISLPNTVTTVGRAAFYGQHGLLSIDLPTVCTLGSEALSHCTNLNRVYMPVAEIIGNYAFSNCTNLVSLSIPESVTTMGENVFEGCALLRELFYTSSKAPTNWTATTKTYVPDVQAYSSPAYRMNDAHIVEMISFTDKSFTYTGQSPTTSWTSNVEGYTTSLSMPTLNSEVGDHEEWIPVTFTKGEESFTARVVYRYTITPAILTVKAANLSREYGEDNPNFTLSYSGFVNGENESVLETLPNISTTATKKSDVGEYPITISGGSAKNYELVYDPGVLTVSKAPLSAKVNDANKVYGTQNPTFTIDYYGLKNNESTPAWTTSPTFQTDATQASGVGAYAVKAVNGVPINYDLGEVIVGTLNITPAPLTIKANGAVRQYYSDDPTFGYTCNGFVNGDNESVLVTTPKLSTSATRTSSVGTYEIRVGETSSPNYSISFVNGTLTITPRTLIASVGNYERPYNEENPVFEVKYNGFVGDEDENVLISKPEVKTTATKTSDVGTYPINVTGGSADNYTFSYTSGIFTINKAEQTISWTQDLSGLKIGDQVELKAVASSGLPITYTMDNNSVAEIYTTGKRWYLDCKENGSFLIRAVQNGNENYYSSPKVSNRVTISDNPPTPDPSQVPASISATIGTNGIATLYSIYALNFSTIAGIRAYIVSSFTPATGSVVLTRVKGDVPARTGLILIGDEGSYNIPTGEGKTLVSNMLNGTAEAMVLEKMSGDYTNFILATKDGDTGFYAVKDGTTLAAGRAYLPLPTALLPQDNASRGLMMTFDERGDATAIHSTVSLPNSQQVYSLSGQRVNPNSLSRGLYIVGGKKVVIRK